MICISCDHHRNIGRRQIQKLLFLFFITCHICYGAHMQKDQAHPLIEIESQDVIANLLIYVWPVDFFSCLCDCHRATMHTIWCIVMSPQVKNVRVRTTASGVSLTTAVQYNIPCQVLYFARNTDSPLSIDSQPDEMDMRGTLSEAPVIDHVRTPVSVS